jgi:excisionase family DNA binding protein
MTNTPLPPDRPLTTGQVAKLFGVHRDTVALWADAGRLPSFRTPGGQRRFPVAEIAKLVAAGTATEVA